MPCPPAWTHALLCIHIVQRWLATLGPERASQGLAFVTLDGKVSYPGALQVMVTLSLFVLDCHEDLYTC